MERKTRCQNHDNDTADLFLIIQFNIGLCLHYKTGSNNINFRQTRPTVLSKILPICLFWSTTILQYVRPPVRGHYSVNVLPFQNRTMPSTTKISQNSITSTQQSPSQWMSPKETRTRYKHNTHDVQCMFLKRNNRVRVTGEKNAYTLLYDSLVQTSTRTLHIA